MLTTYFKIKGHCRLKLLETMASKGVQDTG